MGNPPPTFGDVSILWRDFYKILKDELEGRSLGRKARDRAKQFLEDAYGAAFFLERWHLFGTAKIPSNFFKKLEAYGLAIKNKAKNETITVRRVGEGFKNEIADYLGFLKESEDNEEKKLVLEFFGKISKTAGREGVYWRFPKPLQKALLPKAE